MAGFFAAAYAFMAGAVAFSIAVTLRSEDSASPLAKSFLYFSLGTLVWNAAYAAMTLSTDESFVRLVYRASSLGWGANPSLALSYAVGLYDEHVARIRSRRLRLLVFAPIPLIWYGVFAGKILAVGFERGPNGWIERMDPSSPWNWAFVALMLVGLGIFFYIGLELARRSRTNRARLHARLITFPVSLMIVLVIVFHIVLPLAGLQKFPPTAQLLLALWLVVVSAKLQRYPVFSLSPRIAADAIVGSMSDMCFLVDPDGLVSGANEAVLGLLGRGPASLAGRAASEVLSPEVATLLGGAAKGTGVERGAGAGDAAAAGGEGGAAAGAKPADGDGPGEGEGRIGRLASAEVPLRAANGQEIPCAVTVNKVRDSLGDPVGYVVIAREIREISRLRRLSETDSLTEAHNRRKMEELLREALEALRRYATPFTAIMLDIDRFKDVNDRFGHEAGDGVLVELSGVVRASIRANDSFARWGGEEFLILCGSTVPEDALILAERIRQRIEEKPLGICGKVTVSLGLAGARRDDTVESLMQRADRAMYASKEGGRNRSTVYSPGL